MNKEKLKTRLIGKVKPEVLKALKNEAEIKYSSSYKAIIYSLADVERYRDLTIKQILNLENVEGQEPKNINKLI